MAPGLEQMRREDLESHMDHYKVIKHFPRVTDLGELFFPGNQAGIQS
jgi:hypothetical protein